MKPRLVASCLACVMAISAHAFLHAQQSPHGGANVKPQPGPNINAAAGIFDPTDPAALVKADVQMQRQNEIVLAASVRNADHLLAAGNDYRFVDFPQDQFFGGNMTIFTRLFAKLFGMPERRLPSRSAASIGAWTGVYRSCNRGRSWIGGAVPGSPLDFSEASLASPIKAFSNAAAAQGGHAETTDAVLVPGPAGRMHLIVLAFVRFPNGSVGESRMYHVSYTDRNNHEGGTCFNYDRTTEIDRSTAHVTSSVPAPFLDKGAMAVDQDGTLYVAYTVFMEGENSKVVVARSTNGGATWTKTTPLLTLGFLRNHGTTLTVDPLNGTVYLAWRLFYDKWPMMVVSKSYDKGRTFLPATPISHWWPSKSLKDIVKQLKASKLRPFDQFTSEPGPPETATARSLAFPHLVSGVVNGRSKLFAVWQERVDVNPGSATFGQPLATGSPRIVMSMSTDGGWSWTARKAVDAGSRTEHLEQPGVGPIVTRPSGPQVQPALNISGTTNPQLAVLYHEARDELAQPFENNFISGIGRRMDVRIARLNPATGQLVAPSVQVSQYPIKANSSPAELAETAPGYKKVHRPNLTMYSGGQRAFFGDYPALASSQVFETGTPWKWAIEASSLLAMWTDNRDVQFPLNPVTLEPDINAPWTGYQAIKPIDPTDPGTPQPSSCGQVATRNANPYFAEIAGLVAGAPQTFKPLNIQRSFVTYFENRTPEDRFFRLTLQDNEAGGVDGSFDQFSFTEADDVRDVKIFANSGHTRTLWVQPSANETASVRVIAQEIVVLGGALKTDGLRARVILNPDPTNHALTEVPPTAPGFGGATIEDSEIHNPQISSPQISTFSNRAPQISSPQISTPQISSPQISTPQISTPGEAGPQISSPQISTPAVGGEVNGMDVTFTVKNQGNTTTQYEALLNVPSVQELIASGNYQFQLIVTRTSLVPGFVQTAMGCEPALVPKVQVISNVPIPQISSPQISTISNPQISSPQISTPQISTFWVEPEGGAEGQNSHGDEGNEDAHSTVVPDEVKITLRATRLTPMAAGGPTFTPEQAADVVARVDSVSTNVVDGIVQPEGSQPGAITFPDLVVANYVPAAATLTTAPGGQVTLSAWRHQNQGTAPANAADETISAGFYLSTDAVITASDVRLGGIVNTNAELPIGGGFNWSAPAVTIPAATAPGNYFIGILVDELNEAAESNEGNNFVSEPIEVVGTALTAELAITITSPDSVTLGQNVAFAFQVTNNGPAPATNVTFVGNFGAGLTFVSATNGCAFGSPCVLGTLAPGASTTVTVTMRADAPGSLAATATVSADQADPTPANNNASDTTNVGLTSCSGVSFSGPHVFQAIDPKGAPLELAHGDFNEDGFVDVVESIQERGGGVALLLNNGTGGLLDGTFFQLTLPAWSLAVADYNGDSNLDVAVATGNATTAQVTILLGNGAGGLSLSPTPALPLVSGTLTTVRAADLDGDGDQDLVATSSGSGLRAFYGDGSGGFAAPLTLTVPANPIGVVLGDFNEDGAPDIAVGHNNVATFSIVNSNGLGGFLPAVGITTAQTGTRVWPPAGDLNADTHVDLLVSDGVSPNRRITRFLGTGTGAFGPQLDLAVGTNVLAGTLADINGDGRLDVVSNDGNTGTASVQLGDGTGGAGAPVRFSMEVLTPPITLDVNRDGRMDVAVGAPDSDIGIFLNTCGQPPANLSVDISDAPDPVANGALVTYTIDVANAGPDAATDVLVAQVVPSGFDFVSAVSSQGSCTFFHLGAQFITGTVGCPLGTLPSGGSASITVTARAVAGGTRTSSVTVTSNQFDPSSADNSAFETTTVNAGAVTLTVVNTDNSGPGSLRQAIIDANLNFGQRDTIAFNISGGGTQTITLSTALPNLTDPVIIDGTTQPGYNGTPLIELNGNGLPAAGLNLGSPASDSTIRGLAINRFGGAGIFISSASSGNTILGNFIGTDVTGTIARPNGSGIQLGGFGNQIGGQSAGLRNLVSGNSGPGVLVTGANALNNVIQGSYIGTAANGLTPLPNGQSGIVISNGASSNTIGGLAAGAGNVISGNTVRGIEASSGTENRISGNSVFNNGALGIDLGTIGVTPNDTGDGDTGANNLQNFPVVTSATTSAGLTTVIGTLNSTAQTQYTLEFFTNATCDGSGNGEGQTFVGLTTVTTNADGNASFQTTVSASTIVTATATDPSGNTSEFSACVTAGGPSANLRVATTDAPDPVTLNGELVYTVTVTNDGPSPATGVSLTQTLGAGVTFLSSSPMACDVTAQGALCPIGSLASGASSVVTIRARATAAGIHSSTSTVQANEPDPNAANNTAAATTMVIAYGPCQAGTFGPPAIYPAGRNTEIVALGDFNEDGIVDVVASNDTGNPRGIQLLIGNGDGTFDPPVYFQAGADGMSVGDFDRDGNLDVVTANENDQVTILYGNGAGGFPRVTRFPTGLEDAGGAFSADLTGDGFLDVVLGIEDEGGVAYLMRNDGAGGLLAPVALPSGTELGGIDLEDFNGDGFIDIATANGGDSTISILRNNGTGVFTEVSRLPVDTLLGIRPVGDLNGDGRPDIGLGREVTGDLAISVYFNSASGAFTGPIDIIQTSVDIHDVTAADVTGDGFRDLVMFGSIVQVLRNDGTGNFGPPAVYAISTDPGNLTIGDVNGDGRPDILVGLENAGVGVLLNRCGTQTGSANLAVTMTDSADPVTTGSEFTYTITVTNLGPDVATGVIVNDALPAPDVVFAGMVTGTCTFVGDDAMTCPIGTLPVNGTATITFRVRGYNGVRTNAATAIADQADPDFSNNAASQTTVITPIFGPCGEDTFNGTFASPTTFAAGLNTYMSALGDFNEDGIVDVVVTDASTTGRVAVLRGNGNGTFQAAVFVSVGANPNGIVVADFDEDGNLDFATANQVGNSVSIAYGDGTGGFPTVSTIPVGAINPIGIATADVTGDGNLDLVIGAQAAGSVARLLVGVPANRDFTPQIALPSGQMPREVVLDDYDGDGDIDIVTGNGANATISVLTNNGTGTFTQTTVLSTGANPRVRRTGDLNSDGRPDIMYVSAAPVTGNAVFVYLSTPAGGFTGPTEVIPANFGAFHGAVADLNGDGFLDIANVTGGNMSVFAGHGDGGFHFTGSYTHGPASNTLTIGDVNGDARPDILVARAGSGVVSLFLSRCGAQTGEAELSVVKTDSADPVAVNSQFTYTIAVTNNGPDVATNVIVTDSLPTPNIQFLGMVTGTCTFVAGSLTCPIGTIQVGQTASITMNVRAVNGTRFNLATAIGDQVDPNFFNNTAFQQTTITPGAGTFVVSNTADSGQGSLRQAIIDANTNTGQRDTIAFNIGGGNSAQTITLASALANITDSIFINGASQANPNGTPFIELNGNGVALNGFVLTTGSSGSTIRGLAINRFTGAGISINNAASTGNTIDGNFIGTDQTGLIARPNGSGLLVQSANNVIGGLTPTSRNLISGNTGNGILINGGAANIIQGNAIGTNVTRSVALANGAEGIQITGATANNNVIGGTATGAANVIAFNGSRGVNVSAGTGNRISANSIFSNAFIGIDLGSNGTTPNDTGDGDTGANNVQNFPVLTSVITNGGQSTIRGTLNSTASTQFTIEFFDNTECEGNGNGEGRTFVGSTQVTTGADGNATVQAVVGAVTIVTATATDPNGNTSEFSGCGPFMVTNTNDSGPGSLRQAILDANAKTGADWIGFNIPGPGPYSIALTSALPNINDTVGIDGTTQPGFSTTPIIELNGTAVAATGLTISDDSSVIRGLVINRFGGAGILLAAPNNVIEGNFIGTDVTGTIARPNLGSGVVVNQPNNVIGGATAGGRNVISGNNGSGILLSGGTPNGTQVINNIIGADVTGAVAVPNGVAGVQIINGFSNTIGGAAIGRPNVIAFNNGPGIAVSSGAGNAVVRNSIFGNTGLGIDLGPTGPTPNDPGDIDSGANDLLNFPILTSATPNGAQTTVQGTFNSLPQVATFSIEIFGNAACDPAGNGEGQTFIAATNVTTDASGNASFSVTIPSAAVYTATATNSVGNTSEFSGCQAAVVPPATFTVTNTNDSGPGSLRQAMLDARNDPGVDIVAFNIPGNGPHTIQLLVELTNNAGSDGVIIDGTTQPGWAAVQRPVIEIDGSLAGGNARAFVFGGGNSVLRGLAINRFGTGGTGGDRFLGEGSAVFLGGSGNSVVEGCFIGTDVTGTIARPNRNDGIAVLSQNNRIGGPGATQRNVISANGRDGVFASLGTGTPNVIQNNFIGVDGTGTVDLGNGAHGVNVSSGPGAMIQNNVIAGNNQNGIQYGAADAVITNNFIGTNPSLVSGLGNTLNGISFSAATGASVNGNTIAFNGSNGVLVSATSNADNITFNSTFSNGGLGIDLSPPGLTPNDAGDADTGANGLQNFPVLTSAQTTTLGITVIGSLSSGSGNYRIDFYSNTTCDPSGHGEGQTFLASRTVTTTGGIANINESLPFFVTGFVTATATDSAGNTSEFSPCRAVTLVNSSNLRAYVAHGSGQVTVVNAGLNSAIGTVVVGSGSTDVALNASGSRAFVTNTGSNSVSVINTATNTVIATIAGITTPINIATNPARPLAYVTGNLATVYVIDTAANSIVTSIPVAGANDVVVSPDGARAYVSSTTGNGVVVLDTATNAVLTTVPITGAAGSIALSPAGDRVYVSRTSGGPAVSVIDTATNTLQISVPVTNADAIAVAPDNSQVYVANFNGESITRISTSSLTVIGSFASNSPQAIAMLPDGRAYIGEIDDGIVSVVTLSTNTVATSFTTQPQLSAIAVGTINIPPP